MGVEVRLVSEGRGEREERWGRETLARGDGCHHWPLGSGEAVGTGSLGRGPRSLNLPATQEGASPRNCVGMLAQRDWNQQWPRVLVVERETDS